MTKEKVDKKCDTIEIQGKQHSKFTWLQNIDHPYHLAFDKHKEMLYFSYNYGSNEEDTFQVAYVEKKAPHKVHNISIANGFATAIDQENHVVYIGADRGIYKYHPDKHENKKINNKNIWSMFLKKELYFITYPKQQLYKINVHKNESKSSKVKHNIDGKIYLYGIDGNNNEYFTNNTGLYKIKNGTNDIIHYEGEKIFRALAVNNKGEIHFAGKNGIYVTHKHNHTLEEIAHIRNIFGLTFDQDDNIIYSDAHNIITVLSKDTC